MNFRHTNNPVLNGIETKIERNERAYATGETATFSGIAIKTGMLLLIILGISSYIWNNLESMTAYISTLLVGSIIVSILSVILAHFVAKPFFTILYAVAEGVLLGTFSSVVSQFTYPGIVMNAVTITFAIFGFLLIVYSTGIFKVGFRFRKIVYTITFGIFFFFMISFILNLFGLNLTEGMPFEVILLLTIGMVLLGSFYLLIDFDNCKRAVQHQLPKEYEWQLSLGLLVSLVFVYVYVLRLLILISGRRN